MRKYIDKVESFVDEHDSEITIVKKGLIGMVLIIGIQYGFLFVNKHLVEFTKSDYFSRFIDIFTKDKYNFTGLILVALVNIVLITIFINLIRNYYKKYWMYKESYGIERYQKLANLSRITEVERKINSYSKIEIKNAIKEIVSTYGDENKVRIDYWQFKGDFSLTEDFYELDIYTKTDTFYVKHLIIISSEQIKKRINDNCNEIK